MSDDAMADEGRTLPGADHALSIDDQELELDIARLVFIAVAAVCAVAVVEFLHWLLKGVGGKVGERHPFATELVGELADRFWRAH